MDLVIDTNADETDSDKSTEESLVERLKQIQESSDTIHNEFNKRNKKIIEQKVDDRLKMN